VRHRENDIGGLLQITSDPMLICTSIALMCGARLIHEDGFATRGQASTDISIGVANHPGAGQVQIQLAGGVEK
jgi:hypothetical protein